MERSSLRPAFGPPRCPKAVNQGIIADASGNLSNNIDPLRTLVPKSHSLACAPIGTGAEAGNGGQPGALDRAYEKDDFCSASAGHVCCYSRVRHSNDLGT
jgi:hypothetical protein